MATGVSDLQPAREAKRRLKKQGLRAAAHAFDVIVVGGSWFGTRGDMERKCRSCGVTETAFHRYWSCSHLRQMNDEAVTSTADMIELVSANL